MKRPAIMLRERSRTINLSFYGVPFSVPESPLPAGSVALEWDASQAPGVHYRLHISGHTPGSIDLGPCTSTTVHGLRSPENHVFTVAAFYPGNPSSEFDHSNAVIILPKPILPENDLVKRPAFLPRSTKPVRDLRKTVDFSIILLIALGLLAVCGIILLLS